jgi:hypothetical protein
LWSFDAHVAEDWNFQILELQSTFEEGLNFEKKPKCEEMRPPMELSLNVGERLELQPTRE